MEIGNDGGVLEKLVYSHGVDVPNLQASMNKENSIQVEKESHAKCSKKYHNKILELLLERICC